MQNDTIRYRPDGSIDADYYLKRGKVLRSEAAHIALRGVKPVARKRHSLVVRFLGLSR